MPQVNRTEPEVEERMEIDITKLLAQAGDAGFSEEEAIVAILDIAKYQAFIHKSRTAV